MKTKESIIAKEAKELAKWEKMKAKPMPKGYMTIMVVIISIVYLLDSLSTDLHGGLSELEITYFSGQLGMPYETVLSLFSIVSALSIVFNLVAPFYKALADKWGRKRLFVISTIGMGAGLVLGYFSTNLATYVIGRVLLTFFVISDIQVIYIMEVAPADKRAKLFSITKCLSILGVLIIPLCRDLILDPTGSNWRDICIVPALIAVVCVFLISLFIRESDVFLDKKIAYLKTPYEERQAEIARKKTSKEVDTNKAGIGTAIQYIAKDKQLRSITISFSIFLLGMCSYVSYFNTICLKSGMDTDAITTALYIYPLTSALATFLAGFVSDKLGRKATCAIYAVLSFGGMAAYIALAGKVNPIVIGAFYGLCSGGYWVIGDTIQIMLSESAKTEIRSSVSAALGFASLLASLVSTTIYSILILSVPIAPLCMVGAVITMTALMIVLMTGTKETKGASLI